MSTSQSKKGLVLAAQRCSVGEMQYECDSDTFQVLKAGDDRSDPKVICQLGMCYHFGWGIAKDLRAAVQCYIRAAGLCSFEALDRLWWLRNDQSVETDLQNAFRVFRKKADQGDAKAQFNVGYCHYWRIGTPEDRAKARDLFLKAADQGCADAMWMLEVCRAKGVGNGYNGMQEIALLKYAAEMGSAEAQYQLGYAYDCGRTTYGLEVEKDYKQAVEWYQKAADQNHTEATYNLACCYRNGYGVQKDIKKAFQLWKKAAMMGYEYAQDIISEFYRHEYFILSENEWQVDIDYYEAAYWNRKAVDQNHKYAKKSMPYILKIIGLTPNQIVELMKQTSSFESAKIWYDIARQYETGDGVEKDEMKAFEMYKLSARLGSTEGQVALARCYEQGIDIEKNIQNSMRWNIRTAMQGNTEATSALQKWLQQIGKQSEFKYREQLLTHAINALKEISPQHDPDLEIIQLIVENEKERIALLLDFFNKGQDPPDNAKTFETCKLAIEYDIRAVYWMVRHYQHSKNIADDFAGIPQLLQREAVLEKPETAYSLARCHMLELGTPKNEVEAVDFYRLAAENNYAAALHELGHCYQSGTAVEQSIYKAIELYKKAAEQQHILALKILADIYESGDHGMKDLEQAFVYHQRAAKLGDVDEQLRVAECYKDGIGVERDDRQALYWFQKAAHNGRYECYKYIAECYMNGIGVEQNGREAFCWFQKAVHNGEYECYKYIAECYDQGIGTKVDQEAAFENYRKLATALPTKENLIILAERLENGVGTQKDVTAAVKYYQQAGAHSKLGDIYFNENYVDKNYETALNHYKRVEDFNLTQLLNVMRIFKLCQQLRGDGLFYFKILKLTANELRTENLKIEIIVW